MVTSVLSGEVFVFWKWERGGDVGTGVDVGGGGTDGMIDNSVAGLVATHTAAKRELAQAVAGNGKELNGGRAQCGAVLGHYPRIGGDGRHTRTIPGGYTSSGGGPS